MQDGMVVLRFPGVRGEINFTVVPNKDPSMAMKVGSDDRVQLFVGFDQKLEVDVFVGILSVEEIRERFESFKEVEHGRKTDAC